MRVNRKIAWQCRYHCILKHCLQFRVIPLDTLLADVVLPVPIGKL